MRDVAESSLDSDIGDSDLVMGENVEETELPFDLSKQKQLTGYSLLVSSKDVHLPKVSRFFSF